VLTEPQAARRVAQNGGLHLAGTFERIHPQSPRPGQGRQRSVPAGPEATQPPPSTVAIFADGRRTTGMTK
jgi:hypothetical protein